MSWAHSILDPRPVRRGPSRFRAGGLATLATVLALLTLAAWAAVFGQRAALNELRATASQLHAAEAFEAAQGGLDWALGLLQAGPVDGTCMPASAPQGSLAERLALGPVEMVCRRSKAGWACRCPAAGPAALDDPTVTTPPAFRVVATRPDPAGPVHLRAIGFGSGGAGQAAASVLASPAPGASPTVWRRVPGSWRDF